MRRNSSDKNMDPRWRSFENFLEDVGYPPTKNHYLMRNSRQDNYTKENVRWRLRNLKPKT